MRPVLPGPRGECRLLCLLLDVGPLLEEQAAWSKLLPRPASPARGSLVRVRVHQASPDGSPAACAGAGAVSPRMVSEPGGHPKMSVGPTGWPGDHDPPRSVACAAVSPDSRRVPSMWWAPPWPSGSPLRVVAGGRLRPRRRGASGRGPVASGAPKGSGSTTTVVAACAVSRGKHPTEIGVFGKGSFGWAPSCWLPVERVEVDVSALRGLGRKDSRRSAHGLGTIAAGAASCGRRRDPLQAPGEQDRFPDVWKSGSLAAQARPAPRPRKPRNDAHVGRAPPTASRGSGHVGKESFLECFRVPASASGCARCRCRSRRGAACRSGTLPGSPRSRPGRGPSA